MVVFRVVFTIKSGIPFKHALFQFGKFEIPELIRESISNAFFTKISYFTLSILTLIKRFLNKDKTTCQRDCVLVDHLPSALCAVGELAIWQVELRFAVFVDVVSVVG